MRQKAQVLGEEGEELRHSVHVMTAMKRENEGAISDLEEAINAASLRRQEAEEDLEVLEPKHALMQQEHARVMTTIAELKLQAEKRGEVAARAEEAEEDLKTLLSTVMKRKTLDMQDVQKQLDEEAAELAPQLKAAVDKRNAAKQELADLRYKISMWTSSGLVKKECCPTASDANISEDVSELMRNVTAAAEAAKRGEHLHMAEDADEEEVEQQAFNETMKAKFMSEFGTDSNDHPFPGSRSTI